MDKLPNLEFVHPLKLFDIAKKEKRLLYTSAPMVRYSKLAFRQTVFEYGTDLCWTPMILAKEFNRNHFARDSDFTISTAGPQPPTIVQFGANVPQELARASSLVAPFCSGVDLNCGCPQSWACAETLGAALMERRELVRDMVVETREQLRRDGWGVGREADIDNPRGRSVSVKIRVHKDLRKTVDFITTVLGPDANNRNIDFLTIHPRTRSTPSSTPINLDALELLTSTFGLRVPILLSGDVFALHALPFPTTHSAPTFTTTTAPKDPSNNNNNNPTPTTINHEKNPLPLTLPHLSGLMSARAILRNPALYAGAASCPWSAVDAFLSRAARAPLPLKLVLHHLSEMCGPALGPDGSSSSSAGGDSGGAAGVVDKSALLTKKERAAMMRCENMLDLVDFLDERRRERGDKGGVERKGGDVGDGES